jgi:hypothetical protein
MQTVLKNMTNTENNRPPALLLCDTDRIENGNIRYQGGTDTREESTQREQRELMSLKSVNLI